MQAKFQLVGHDSVAVVVVGAAADRQADGGRLADVAVEVAWKARRGVPVRTNRLLLRRLDAVLLENSPTTRLRPLDSNDAASTR